MFFLIQFWRNIWRSPARSLLTVGIALCLFAFAGVYFGNIDKNEALLQNLADSIPVPVHVANRAGTLEMGLEIDSRKVDALLTADLRDPMYTAMANGNLEPVNRVENPRSFDTSLMGLSDATVLAPSDVTLAEGADLSFLAENAPLCLVAGGYAREHGLGIGDTITLPIHTIKYAREGSSFHYLPLGEVTLEVAGILEPGVNLSSAYNNDVVVPVAWLRGVAEAQGRDFYYDSFRARLSNPLELNRFKEEMGQLYFAEVRSGVQEARSGGGLVIQDKVFIETATKIQENIRVLRAFRIPILAVTVLIVMLFVFLLLRGQRRQLALAGALGQSRMFGGAELFAETLFLVVVGCLLAMPLLRLAVGVSVRGMLRTLLLFGGCAALGIGLSLVLLFRFDTLRLLTQAD